MTSDVATEQRILDTRSRLGIVLLLFGLLSALLLINDLSRTLEWDEAVYVAEAKISASPVSFREHRARGIVWLIALPTNLGVSLPWIRLGLIVVSLAGISASVAIWWPLARWWALVAGAAFCTYWLVLFYSAEISPNLFVALALVVSFGLSLRWLRDGHRADVVGALLALAIAVQLRPTDVAFALIGATTVLLTAHRGRRLAFGLWSAAAVAMIPWIIEAFVAFGGPLQRLREAAEITSAAGLADASGLQAVYLLDGPLIGPDHSDRVAVVALVYAATVAALLVLSLLVAVRNRQARRAIATPCLAGLVLAVSYVTTASVSAPRFMIPVLGLLLFGAAAAGHAAGGLARLAIGGLLLGLLVSVPWQVAKARETNDEAVASRAESATVAAELERLAAGRPCAFASQYGYPAIAVLSGCDGVGLAPDGTLDHPGFPAGADPIRFLVYYRSPAEAEVSPGWTRTPVPLADGRTVTIVTLP